MSNSLDVRPHTRRQLMEGSFHGVSASRRCWTYSEEHGLYVEIYAFLEEIQASYSRGLDAVRGLTPARTRKLEGCIRRIDKEIEKLDGLLDGAVEEAYPDVNDDISEIGKEHKAAKFAYETVAHRVRVRWVRAVEELIAAGRMAVAESMAGSCPDMEGQEMCEALIRKAKTPVDPSVLG